jgi:2,4-dienoyl-CoA reductase-like NADH-dependent reductase (Old Yellow Enzyme family)
MTMYNSVDGKLDDYRVCYLGARAAGGFAPVFGEQMAITPDGRTTTSCASIWSDDQIEGHARVCAIIKRMGAVPAIQLGHTGSKGSELPPNKGALCGGAKKQLPPDHPDGWTYRAPSAIPFTTPRRWRRGAPPRPATSGSTCTTHTATSGRAFSPR